MDIKNMEWAEFLHLYGDSTIILHNKDLTTRAITVEELLDQFSNFFACNHVVKSDELLNTADIVELRE